MRKGATLSYFANDHLGSTSVVMNSAGAKVSETRYFPYGNIWTQTISATPPTDKLFTPPEAGRRPAALRPEVRPSS